MLNKQNLVLTSLAGNSPAGILISDNFTAATNGHVLAFVNRPHSEADEFPASPDGTPAQVKQGRFIIRKEDAEKFSKAIPRSRTFPIMENIMPLEPCGTLRRFLVGDIGSMQIATVIPIEEKFPKISAQIWPKQKATIEINFSVTLLEKLLCAMKKAAKKQFPIVTFTLYDPEEPVKFRCDLTDEGQKMTGLIMPCKK